MDNSVTKIMLSRFLKSYDLRKMTRLSLSLAIFYLVIERVVDAIVTQNDLLEPLTHWDFLDCSLLQQQKDLPFIAMTKAAIERRMRGLHFLRGGYICHMNGSRTFISSDEIRMKLQQICMGGSCRGSKCSCFHGFTGDNCDQLAFKCEYFFCYVEACGSPTVHLRCHCDMSYYRNPYVISSIYWDLGQVQSSFPYIRLKPEENKKSQFILADPMPNPSMANIMEGIVLSATAPIVYPTTTLMTYVPDIQMLYQIELKSTPKEVVLEDDTGFDGPDVIIKKPGNDYNDEEKEDMEAEYEELMRAKAEKRMRIAEVMSSRLVDYRFIMQRTASKGSIGKFESFLIIIHNFVLFCVFKLIIYY